MPAESVVSPLLEVDRLSVTYGGRRNQGRAAVDGVSFSIGRGEILALVGESGCGKTTVARALARLIPARGSVRLDGCDLLGCGRAELEQARRRLGMVFQDPVASLNPKRRVGDIVAEPLRAAAAPGDHRAAVRRALSLVGLTGGDAGEQQAQVRPDAGAQWDHAKGSDGSGEAAPGGGMSQLLERRPGQLSGGQCQRVSLARALVASPKLLICDEATAALDAHNRAAVLRLLDGYRHELGLAVLFITHDLAAAWQLADRVAIMRAGRLVEVGPPDQVFRHPVDSYTQSLVAAVPTGRRRP